jgi:hypothetical protein
MSDVQELKNLIIELRDKIDSIDSKVSKIQLDLNKVLKVVSIDNADFKIELHKTFERKTN